MTAIPAFHLYKQKVYGAISSQTFSATLTALEAGKGKRSGLGNQFLMFFQNTPGEILSAQGKKLVPGLTIPDKLELMVFHNPACLDDWCLEDFISSKHCKANTRALYFRFHGGFELKDLKHPAPWSC